MTTKMAEEEKEETLFEHFFPIPHIRYSDAIIKNMSVAARKEWDEFLKGCNALQDDIKTIIIPLAFDQTSQVYWMDYPGSYVRHFHLNPQKMPELIVVMKITDDLKYDPRRYITVQHCDITGALKEKVLKQFGEFPWFEWDGSEESAMCIYLDD